MSINTTTRRPYRRPAVNYIPDRSSSYEETYEQMLASPVNGAASRWFTEKTLTIYFVVAVDGSRQKASLNQKKHRWSQR